ncbi:hypothetical protein, conserved [Leishmania tarentolae]|uniref:Transmembrane protein n=1 Tax=Leishmania tarentolae TaxID=5689 RepID=A0A640KEJ7_LEITA|nr:hypothetical protein, conserved [Leishmania tarentolae]
MRCRCSQSRKNRQRKMKTKSGERSAYSFFDSHRYLWSSQRRQRSMEEIERLRDSSDASAMKVLSSISFDDRVAIRSLFYAVVDDTNLRHLLDGVLLPPPYIFPDFLEKRWTQEDVQVVCSEMNPSLDWVVVNLPLKLSLRLGSYDARLRAAARRLSWILSIPFSLVEREENLLANVHTTVVRDAAAEEADVARQKGVLKSKEQQKRSLTRAATIGGFTILSGAALLVTGGLAAPVVGPAYAALVTGTATTLGVLGAVGGAVLGTGALAAVFSTIVGVATHAAALASVVTPVLTAANMTAIFGVTGASLGGYKAFRRTTESDIFALRSVDEVETFETEAPAATPAEGAPLNKQPAHWLACPQQLVEKRSDATGTSRDLSAVLEEHSKPGIITPLHTRTIAMSHVRNLPPVQKRRRHVVFAVENNLDGYELRLKAFKLFSGVWVMTPPAVIAPARAGVFACVNRFAHPTGAGFIVCYVATPLPGTTNATALRIWVRAERDFFGAWALSAACEKATMEFDPTVAENWTKEHLTSSDFTRRQQGVALEMHIEPYTYLRLHPAGVGDTPWARTVTFPKEELPQRLLEYAHDVQRRRKLGVSLVNRSSHDVFTRELGMINGEQWPQTPSPIGVYPAEASLTYFTNSEWSLAGAEGYYIVEVVNRNSKPVTPRFYIRAQFEVTSLNNVNVAFASAYNVAELMHQSLTPAPPSSTQFCVDVPPGLFFSITCIVDVAHYTLQVVFQDFVERLGSADALPAEKMTLTIGVSGYSAIFDPRRPVQDQQVGLWQTVLRRSALLGLTESYVLQWEDEFLVKFGETIHANLDVADTLMRNAVGAVTQKTLMRGAMYTGLHAVSSLMSAVKLPLFAVWATSVIDNTFATLSSRSAYTGKDLAAALLDKQRGNRPVTLVGFSFGSLVIVECLRELERVEAYGIVENVYLLGCTCSSDPGLWCCLRRVVAGRLVNVYTREDWTLWMMYRLNRTHLKPMAGINPVNTPGVENVDVTPLVSAHGDYAVKLLSVLDAIPPEPTPETWSPRQHYGSPGVTVPLSKCRETMAAVCNSLHSYMTATPYVAVGVNNCVVSDIAHYEPKVELLTVQVYDCFFDFMPPPLTGTGMSSVAGLLGDTEKAMGAVVAYRMRLPPSSPRDLLIVLYLCCSSKGHLQVCARPNLVERCSFDTEMPEQVYERLCTITAEACQALDDVQRMCSTHGAQWELCGGAAQTQSILVPVPEPFDDTHQTATFRVVLERVDRAGVTMTVLALLTSASTQLQQETFDEGKFNTAMAVIGGHRAHYQDDGNEMQLPVTAETCSTDHLQQQMYALAAQLRDPAKYPPNTVPFALVNCGMSPLYFSETFHNDARVTDTQQVPSCIRTMPQWLRFPPPEIPPTSFAVALMRVHNTDSETHLAVSRVRYETNNGQCAFDVEFSDNILTDGGTEEGAELATAPRCTPVKGRPYVGDITFSTAMIQTTPFVIIMMVPATAMEASVDVEDSQDTAEARMHAQGWCVM